MYNLFIALMKPQLSKSCVNNIVHSIGEIVKVATRMRKGAIARENL